MIFDQFVILSNQNLITVYVAEENENKQGQPSNFNGVTERGIEVLNESKHLRGVPALRAVHDNTIKSERLQRHEAAPRPELSSMVANALEFDEEAVNADELKIIANQSISADRASKEGNRSVRLSIPIASYGV